MFRGSRFAVAALAAGLALPAVALAGKTVVSGQQSLQLKVTMRPARAGARGVMFRLQLQNKSTQPGDPQPPYNTRSIIFTEAKGVQLDSRAAPSCRESKVIAAKGNASVCPAGSRIGHGSVVVNARPTVPTLINGTVAIYNGVNDGGYAGYPKGSRELILYVKTTLGVNAVTYFHIVKVRGVTKLIAKMTKPAQPGIVPGDVTLEKLDLVIPGSAQRPIVSAPKACSGSWGFALTINNWFGQPSITARDRVKCAGA